MLSKFILFALAASYLVSAHGRIAVIVLTQPFITGAYSDTHRLVMPVEIPLLWASSVA